jgi:hypothetical protein
MIALFDTAHEAPWRADVVCARCGWFEELAPFGPEFLCERCREEGE